LGASLYRKQLAARFAAWREFAEVTQIRRSLSDQSSHPPSRRITTGKLTKPIEAMKDVDGLREMVIKSQRAENEQILISISNTGIGVPPRLAEQNFDAFFTIKPHGTGMGLRISRSIVESHGGRLWLVGVPGRDAIFQFTLPNTVVWPARLEL
jgi:signal transduction histidine kinase